MNVKKIWDIASKTDLYRYLGHKKYDVKHIKEAASAFLGKLEVETHGTLLDAGCGICIYDVYWAEHVDQIIAVDVSSKMLKKAKTRIRRSRVDNIYLIQCDIRRLPLRRHIATWTVCIGILKHIPNNPRSTYQALREVKRVTKEKLYVNDLPLRTHPQSWIHKSGMFLFSLASIFTTREYHYLPWTLSKALSVCGFYNVEFRSYGWIIPPFVYHSPTNAVGQASEKLHFRISGKLSETSKSSKIRFVNIIFSSLEFTANSSVRK